MDISFEKIAEKIDELNTINTKASYSQSSKYNELFWQIYDSIIEMENSGEIIIEPNKKHISYLRDILENDGPEYTYTIVFWPKGNELEKYKIGVCVRGLPILKKIE